MRLGITSISDVATTAGYFLSPAERGGHDVRLISALLSIRCTNVPMGGPPSRTAGESPLRRSSRVTVHGTT